MVQFLFPPPERTKFETSTGLPRPKLLDFLDFNIRTKMAVVRLRQRKRPERDRKRPEMGPQGGIRGSDNLPGMAVFCGVPTADQERKKIVPNGWTGGGKGFGASVRTRFGTPVNFNPHAAFFGRALSGRYVHLPGTRSMPDRRAPGPCNQLQRASAELFRADREGDYGHSRPCRPAWRNLGHVSFRRSFALGSR
jgi:hypothetical protein